MTLCSNCLGKGYEFGVYGRQQCNFCCATPKWHTRTSDEQMLIGFVEASSSVSNEIRAAVERLRNCHKEELQDYSIIQ